VTAAIERLRELRARVYATLPVSPELEQKLLSALPALEDCAEALEQLLAPIEPANEFSKIWCARANVARAALDALAKEVG